MTPEDYIQACRECSSGERAMELLRSVENIVAANTELLAAGRKMKAIIERSRRYVDERIIDYSEQVKTLTKQVRSLEEQNKTLAEQVGELEAVIEDNRIELMRLGSLSDCIERLAAVTVRLEKADKPAEAEQLNPKMKKNASKKFIPPTLEEVKAYCIERKNSVDPEEFIDHYVSNGWLVGKNMMKDWKAAVRTWEKKNFGQDKNVSSEKKDKPSYDLDKILKFNHEELMSGRMAARLEENK